MAPNGLDKGTHLRVCVSPKAPGLRSVVLLLDLSSRSHTETRLKTTRYEYLNKDIVRPFKILGMRFLQLPLPENLHVHAFHR